MAQVPNLGDREMGDLGDVLLPDDAKKIEMVAKVLMGPMGPQPTAAPDQLAGIPPASVRIDVQNGSGRQGVGAKMATYLRSKGFVVASVRQRAVVRVRYDRNPRTTSKIFGAGDKVKAAIALPNAPVTSDATAAAPTADVTVIIGRDFAYPAAMKSGTQAASAADTK